jgi:carboxyl-terminal processing protease
MMILENNGELLIMKIFRLLFVVPALLSGLNPAQAQEQETSAVQPAAAQLSLADLRSFTEVFAQIRSNYVEEIDDLTLLTSAINGMLSELDPHSAYLPGDEYQDMDDTAR